MPQSSNIYVEDEAILLINFKLMYTSLKRPKIWI